MLTYFQVIDNETFNWSKEGVLILLTGVFLWIGVAAANALEAEWGHDAQKIVIDEIVGVWIALLFTPLNCMTLLLGFILFRFFDIAKPLGVRKMERFKGGWGVMMDDALAGVYAWLVLKAIGLLFPVLGGYAMIYS